MGIAFFSFYNYLWLFKFKMVYVVLYITTIQSVVYRLVLVGKMATVYEYVLFIFMYVTYINIETDN